MKTKVIIILVVILSFAGCSGGVNSTIDLKSLNNVTKKGRLLYEYDLASWIASDSVMARKPDQSNLQYYFAKKKEGKWKVAFGKLQKDTTAFLISYEVEFESDLKSNRVKEYFPPKEDTGWFYTATKALKISKLDFGSPSLKYNYYVLSDTPNVFDIYFIPAQTSNDEMPLGGDIYYTIDANGSEIIKKTKLHNSIIMMEKLPKDAVAGMHTHILIKTPVETDVFFVLRQTPRVKHFIISSEYVFIINADGGISSKEK